MRFQVHTPSGVEDYAGGARYQVELMAGGGVLAVWADDGRKVVYGPAGWHRVEEPAPPPPPPPPPPMTPEEVVQQMFGREQARRQRRDYKGPPPSEA